jgi:hypothetical protein
MSLSQLHQPFGGIEYDSPRGPVQSDHDRADEGDEHFPAALRHERELAPGNGLLEPPHGSEKLAGSILTRPSFQFVTPVEILGRRRKTVGGQAEDPAGKPVGLFEISDSFEGEKKPSPMGTLRGQRQLADLRARDPDERRARFERVRRVSQAFDGNFARDTVRAPYEADGKGT